jgi:hypothetical protein
MKRIFPAGCLDRMLRLMLKLCLEVSSSSTIARSSTWKSLLGGKVSLARHSTKAGLMCFPEVALTMP